VARSSARTIFAVAFAAQVLGLIGFKLVWPFLPLYLAGLGVPAARLPLWSGLLDFVEESAMAVAAPVWGVLGDRYGRKIMVVRALFGGTLVIALITVAPNAYTVLGLLALSGLLTGLTSPLNALVAAAAPPDRLSRMMGRMLAGVFVASSCGPLIGGVIGDAIGLRGGFAVGAGFLALAAVLVIVLVREPRLAAGTSARPDPAPKQGFVASVRRMLGVPGFPALFACLGMLTFAGMLLYPILPVLVPRLRDLPVVGGQVAVATAVGLAVGVPGVTGILASWQAHVLIDRWGHRQVLGWTAGVVALVTGSVFFVDSFWPLVALRATAGLFVGVAQVSIGALVGVRAPKDLYSTAFGVVGSVSSVATALGFLGGGVVGLLFGLHSVFLLSAALFAGVAVLATLSLKVVRVAAAPGTDVPGAAFR
jgi:DHA1 family multidrug resistance protein-like MFS transporter